MTLEEAKANGAKLAVKFVPGHVAPVLHRPINPEAPKHAWKYESHEASRLARLLYKREFMRRVRSRKTKNQKSP